MLHVCTFAHTHTHTHTHTYTGLMMEMANLGIEDFRKLVMNGLVDLSETTITFCKSTINFVNDALRLHAPELLEVFIDSFGDIFKNMIELYVDAMNRDENTAMMEGIVKDGEFVLDTFLPKIGERINQLTDMQLPELGELHTR